MQYRILKSVILTIIAVSCMGLRLHAQFQLNGSSNQLSCTCYQVTPDQTNQSGSVWNVNYLDLSNSFDFRFDVFLGCSDWGADGMVFVLQPVSITAGTGAAGIGYGGITPSIGVEIDTYENNNIGDLPSDHISIHQNGDHTHGSANDLAGPVPAIPSGGDIEDCGTHEFRVVWDAATQTMNIYFDGFLRISYTGDIVNDVFGGNPNVYWGFTAATGGLSNETRFCLTIDPNVSVLSQAGCANMPITFTDSSYSTLGPLQDWQWDFGDGNSGTGESTTHAYTNPGTYTASITVTDLSGCTATKDFTVVVVGINTNASSTNASCTGADGSAQITASSNFPPYTYLWETSAGGGTTAQATGLTTGTYTFSVTDQAGCVQEDSIFVSKDTLLTVTSSITDVTCNAVCDGLVGVAAQNGIAPYTYQWSDGQTTQIATGFCAGTYDVTVLDVNDCPFMGNYVVNEPPPFTFLTDSTNASCRGYSDGTATMTPTGGTTPYTYLWSNGQSNPTATGLSAGAYTVTATDGSVTGCPLVSTISVTEPALIIAQTNINSASICFGQSVTISAGANGGTTPYTYSWSSGQTTASITESPTVQTVYTVSVSDANNCPPGVVSVPVSISPPLNVLLSDDTICDGESSVRQVVVSGGNGPPYQYTWSTGNSTNTVVLTPGSYPASTSYYVSITDGCTTVIDTVTISFHPTPVPSFSSTYATGCEPLFVIFNNSAADSNCVWTLGDGTTVNGCGVNHVYDNPGLFDISLTLTSLYGCVGTLSAPNYVEVHEKPIADYSWEPDPATIIFSTVQFTDLSYGQVNNWEWSIGSYGTLGEQSPSFTFPEEPDTVPVQLIVTTVAGCKDTILYEVIINPDFVFWLPNAFSPNGDGKNDFFTTEGIGIDDENYELRIYNRLGGTIFISRSPNDPWDGSSRATGGSKIQPSGVYVWQLKITDKAGITPKNRVYTGKVTLVR